MSIDRLDNTRVIFLLLVVVDLVATLWILNYSMSPIPDTLIQGRIIGYNIDVQTFKYLTVVKSSMVVAMALLYGGRNEQE